MTPERWRKVKETFHAALDQPANQRASFLDAACLSDADLRSRVEGLLADDARVTLISSASGTAPSFDGNATMSFAGRAFAQYQLEHEIGRGGMGRVYLAQDTRLKRKVALKLLPYSFSEDPERIRRFQQEALAVSALNHPNIITIHEIGEADGFHFLVTEFVDGETLGDIIACGRNDLPRVVKIILQVTEALTAAHDAGIVHRDIKPENIMVRRDGYVKVLDFGLAKLSEESLGGAESRALKVTTTPGILLGTCKYMSPEQARGHKVDSRTDLFSLGVVLYEGVTGVAPFDGETRPDVLIAIAGQQPTPVADYLPEAPAQLHQIITLALKKKQEERYQTAEEMRLDLEELKDLLGPRGTTLAATGSMPSRTRANRVPMITEGTPRKTGILKRAIWALLLLILIGLAGGYLWWNRTRPPAFENIQVRRLTNLAQARFGAISPDGKFLGYAVRDEKGGSLYLKQQGSSATRPVMEARSSVELWALDFSADSNYFYYLIEDVTNRIGGTLYRVPVLGGDPQRIMSGLKAGGFSISPNNRQILFPRVFDDEPKPVEITVVDTDGSHERLIKQVPTARYGRIAWSPDSQSITMVANEHDAAGPSWQLVEFAVSDGAEKPLSPKYRSPAPRDLVWLRDRSALILIALDESSGADQVWQVGSPDFTLRRVTHDLHDYARLSLTADGKSIVTAQNDRETAIWVGPLDPAPAAAVNFHSITSNVNNINGIAPTAEGRIIYSLAANGSVDLWEMNADGKEARQLTANAGRNTQPALSADGRYIVFISTRSGSRQVWRIDRDGSNATQLTKENFDAGAPSCSPNSNLVVFAAREPWSVWTVPLQGGLPIKLADSVETTPAISPDGRQVVYEYLDKATRRKVLRRQPIEGGAVTTIADSDVGFSNIRWTNDGKAIAYVSNKEGRTNVWAQPLDGSAPQKLTDFKSEWLMRFDWSRDGKQLICVRGRLTADLFLISNSNDTK